MELRFVVLEPKLSGTRSFSGRLYCTEKALWKLNWFLRDFGYDAELLSHDQVDERALMNLRGVICTSRITMNGRSFQNLDAFAPAEDWEVLSGASIGESTQEGDADCLYPPNGVTIYPCDKSDCSSIDPELLLRIMLIGYLYGVTSERKLAEELHMYLAWSWFRSSRMVARLVRPCVMRTTVSGSKPCSGAQPIHTRATAGMESTSTPSRSNKKALH